MGSLYSRVADLPLHIESFTLQPLAQTVPSGWQRQTTEVRLCGQGVEGRGEDVTWNDQDHRRLQEDTAFQLAGTYTVDEFSRRLDEFDLFPGGPSRADYNLYRRWAFESAALDLALRQAKTTLANALGLKLDPLTFVISTGLGSPPSIEPLQRRLQLYPDMRFKLDLSEEWTADLVDELRQLDAVDTVDLKGLYHGDFTGPPPNAEQYRMVAEGLPDVWIEDALFNDETRAALADHLPRVTWDANIHAVADIAELPFKPHCINIKPSRFGFISELFRTYEYCSGQGIAMYGGGQFEVGIGRQQAQYLAAMFHPDVPNDISPLAYNNEDLADGLPPSPLLPDPDSSGFAWRADSAGD